MKFTLPALVLLASCAGPPSRSGADAVTAEVIAAVDLMYDDLSERRWDALQSHFLPEATLVFANPKGLQRMTPDKFVEMVRKAVEGKAIFEERMTHAWVRTHQDLAIVWSSFAGREGNGEDVRQWAGVDAFTLVKTEGRWKVSQIAVSQDRPDPKAEKPK